MRREVYLFKPEWQGAFRRHAGGGFPSVFAHAQGGRSLPASSGRVFEPTDIEVGPDGAIYILSWGHAYGGTIENGKQVDAGRVYRIRCTTRNLADWNSAVRHKRLADRSFSELLSDLGSSVPAWRVDAQNEFLRRGDDSIKFLRKSLQGALTKAQQTWGLWTLGRLSPEALRQDFARHKDDLNVHLQTIRILAQVQPSAIDELLTWNSENARLRHATVQAVWQTKRTDLTEELLSLAAGEDDRVVFYSAWNAMGDLIPVDELKSLLGNANPRIRLASLLALFLDEKLTAEEVAPLRTDKDPEVAALVELWLKKTGSGEPLITLSPPPGEYTEPIAVTANPLSHEVY